MAGKASLEATLDALCLRYGDAASLAMDPVSVPLAYEERADRELAAFVAAHLAYGRVAPMLQAIGRVLAPLGPHPARWVRDCPAGELVPRLTPALSGWKWRFHVDTDMVAWIAAWKTLDRETSGGGLEPFFLPVGTEDPLPALVQRLRRDLPPSPGLRFNLPDPASACKRWRIFLRWMVRPGWPDLGLWTRCPPSALIIPLDVHVARVSRFIGLSSRATPDARMALEVTESLRRLDPVDPLRYDFALSHLGIMGDCPAFRQAPACLPCPLYPICHAGR
jgi:uncharacterized protein (TIGR02757 family)